MGIGYDAKDLVTTSEMEKKRNNYKDLVNSLEEKIEKAEQYCSAIERQKAEQQRTLAGSSLDGSGALVTLYDDKLKELFEGAEKLLKYFAARVESAKIKLATAQGRLEYYEGQCKLEDKQEKEIKE